MDLRGIGKRSHFCFDGGQDAGDLFRWALEILGGENPKRDGGNGELAAPIEYLIELARSEAVNRMRIGEAESLPIPSLAVEDDADMRRASDRCVFAEAVGVRRSNRGLPSL